jgi:hypothetical protein
MKPDGWTQGTCTRCGYQTLVKPRFMAHTMSAIPHAGREFHCSGCIRRMRLNGLIALLLLLLTAGGIAVATFMI